MDFSKKTELFGYIVSDSFIIYSRNTSEKSLSQLVSVIISICRAEFTENGILVRGAIAKGEFDKIEAKDISNLQKGLIVGQAYVDAYLMEDSFKAMGLALSEDVYNDICMLQIYGSILSEKDEGKDKSSLHILKYLSLDFLLEGTNLESFVNLAIKSNWLSHYYNILGFALKNEKNVKKVEQVFTKVMNIVSDGKPSENWNRIDTFIEKTFNENVSYRYKKRFLKYLRSKIDVV